MNHKLISKKKQVYPVLPALQAYLDQHGRAMGIPVSYEGNAKVYQPEHLPENASLADMTAEALPQESIEQYVKEERALLARRAAGERLRLNELLQCMKDDQISGEAHVDALKMELWGLTGDVNFKRAKNMGEVLDAALDFIQRNFKSDTPFAQ